MRTLATVLFAGTILTGCGTEPGNSGTDTTDATDDNQTEALYGPENSWWHANEADVPQGLAGTGYGNGDTAHNFTFVDQNGEQVELYQFYGKIVVIDNFAQWCGPCNTHAPDAEPYWTGNDDLVVLGIMMQNNDYNEAGQTDLTDWGTTHGLSHPILGGDTSINDPYIVSGFPTYVVVDRDMTIVNADMWPVDWDAIVGML